MRMKQRSAGIEKGDSTHETQISNRVAVFFFVFPISRSAHLWAPDEVKKKKFAEQSRRPTHFHPAQQKNPNDINIRPKISHKRLS